MVFNHLANCPRSALNGRVDEIAQHFAIFQFHVNDSTLLPLAFAVAKVAIKICSEPSKKHIVHAPLNSMQLIHGEQVYFSYKKVFIHFHWNF